MAIISEIKRRGKTVRVRLDDGSESFLEAAIAGSLALVEGGEIERERLLLAGQESDQIRAKNYASYLLARRNYSTGLLRAKMIERRYPVPVVNRTLWELRKQGILNDRQFASQAVESILRRKPGGRGYLISYLQTKHISRSLAEEVVGEVFGNTDEVELALQLLKPRLKMLAKFELETARRKAYNYLSSRAVGYRAAKLAFERLWKKESQD